MIIVSITGPTREEALSQITGSRRFAGLFELRLDLLHGVHAGELIRHAKKPVVATCRPDWEGGGFKGTENQRLAILSEAAEQGAAYIDLELKLGRRRVQTFAQSHRTAKIILSRHYFTEERIDPRREYQAMRSIGASVFKLAYRADDACDISTAMKFLQLAKKDRQEAVAIAMGEAGEASRVLYRVFGGWATFAAPEGGTPAAEGQIAARLLHDLYRADQLGRSTKIFGVIGNPIEYSKGIYLHNPLFHRARKNAVYCRFKVDKLKRFMAEVFPALAGISVTLPHKIAIMEFVDRVEESAKVIGAVNTVVRERGTLVAENTDAAGALDAIEKRMKVRGRTFLVLGAGGAARAIIVEAIRRGAKVFVANRTFERAVELARITGCTPVDPAGIDTVDIVANATSVGMAPMIDKTPLAEGRMKMKLAFDSVYQPADTRFLREARAQGAITVSGVEMYINQAAAQSRRYTGTLPNRKLMRRLLEGVVHDR